jgi:hypothetical protein
LVLLWLAIPAAADEPKLLPEDAPTFQLRARIAAQGGQALAGKKFFFRLSDPSKPAPTTADKWNDWLKFGPELAQSPAGLARSATI